MLNTVVILILLAAILWIGWTLWKNGWDMKKAGAAIVAAVAAWWVWMNDAVSSLINGM